MSVISSLVITTFSCQSKKKETVISGFTQGTTYTIKIIGDNDVEQDQIDSLLHEFDLSLSTYIDSSVISKMNNTPDSLMIIDRSGFFKTCYNKAYEVYEKTDGAFDPSVYPLVEGWGFMKDMDTPLDSSAVDSILQFVGFEKGLHHTINFSGDSIFFKKLTPGFKIDFNAIAQGLSVDVVSEFLADKGLKNYYVEIGGEVRVSGKNKEGVDWSIGIDMPTDENYQHDIENVVSITDQSIATSGNYRKYYVKDGVKYAHTLDPKSGFPVTHSLLSATVIAKDCATADAYATAFMVLGTEQALDLAESISNVEAYLLYDNGGSAVSRSSSTGFGKYIRE